MNASILREQVVGNIATLVDRAREQSVPVVWVRHSDDTMTQNTPGWQIVADLSPADGEPIVEKTYGDAFADTDLADRLTDLAATSILLCGAQTDACIRSTFYGGLHRGYDVTVVGDAHTTEDMRAYGSPVSPEDSIALFNLHAAFTRLPDATGATVPTAEALTATAGTQD